MKMPKRLIASLGVLMLSATPLLNASADQRGDIVLIAVGTGIVYEILEGVL
ncbi:hypothetical protein PS943_04125 [Pseudomonas fluorescens]|uniref:Uncharacterized protein n=1 Tax=Pseudomonas fluorescens TaxID=294 RepID=A0A5E7WID4_PSEFL|nr:hypothetical protein [Pseudomonas fluorescens]VVQ34958.1 hypothetical protein PS943_04125 [Pseudomonas fluorescens]